MSDITIEDAAEIIEAAELPALRAQPAIDRDLVEEPSIQVRHDSQTGEIEISVDGAGWEIDSVFVEVCGGLVDSDDASSAIEEVLTSLRDADGPRVPVEDLTAIVVDEGLSASAGSASLTDLAQSMADEAIAARSVEFYIHGDSVEVVVERGHGHGAWMTPPSRTVELDIEDAAVSAESVDDAIGALTEAVNEVLAEDLDWIEQAAPRWAAGHNDADWEDGVAYSDNFCLDEAIIDGAREAGHQAVIEALVHYGTCDSVDEARVRSFGYE